MTYQRKKRPQEQATKAPVSVESSSAFAPPEAVQADHEKATVDEISSDTASEASGLTLRRQQASQTGFDFGTIPLFAKESDANSNGKRDGIRPAAVNSIQRLENNDRETPQAEHSDTVQRQTAQQPDGQRQSIQQQSTQQQSTQQQSTQQQDIQRKGEKSSLPVTHQNTAQNTIQRGPDDYGNLKKSDDEEIQQYKALGKQLVAAKRQMESVTKMLQRGRNRTAAMQAGIGVAQVGVSVATLLTGIPGLSGGLNALAGNAPLLNLGVDTLAQEGTAKATKTGMDFANISNATQEADQERAASQMTTGGAFRHALSEKFGSRRSIAITTVKLVPFVSAIESIGKGIQLSLTSKDDWDRQRGVLIPGIREISNLLGRAVDLIDLEAYGDLEIVTANRLNWLAHHRRTLQEVVEQFKETSQELEHVITAYVDKHSTAIPLMAPENNWDPDDESLDDFAPFYEEDAELAYARPARARSNRSLPDADDGGLSRMDTDADDWFEQQYH